MLLICGRQPHLRELTLHAILLNGVLPKPAVRRRQQRAWVGTFADDEDSICQRVWQLLRCGRLEAAQDFCVRVGQPWKAAALGSLAGGPWRDPRVVHHAGSAVDHLQPLPLACRHSSAGRW